MGEIIVRDLQNIGAAVVSDGEEPCGEALFDVILCRALECQDHLLHKMIVVDQQELFDYSRCLSHFMQLRSADPPGPTTEQNSRVEATP
jgi:hypothetical protein